MMIDDSIEDGHSLVFYCLSFSKFVSFSTLHIHVVIFIETSQINKEKWEDTLQCRLTPTATPTCVQFRTSRPLAPRSQRAAAVS
jgi:hypothetical protein